MLFFEEEVEAEVSTEEKVEETVEEEEGGELVLEQLKLLVDVTKTWQRILLGREPIDTIKTLLQPPTKSTSKEITTRAGKATRKKSVARKKSKTGKSKSKRG